MRDARRLADRQRLKRLAAQIIRLINKDDAARSVHPYAINRLKVVESYADGWCYEIGRIRGVRRGRFQLWYDRWPGSKKRVVSYCYSGKSVDVVGPAVSASARRIGAAIKRRGAIKYAADDMPQMSLALKRSEYGKPVFEAYTAHDCYYGVFNKNKGRALHDTAIHAKQFFSTVAACVTANLFQSAKSDIPYPATENRRLVGLHLRWERSKRLAEEARSRDGYQCVICDINFEHQFGRDFARISEAHHIRPLAQFKRPRKTTVDDLITVCPSRHTMLHRMKGTSKDVPALRRIVRRASL